MATGSVIIVLGIIALIALPIILLNQNKKKKDMKFLKDFISMAEKEKIVFSQKEYWRECYAIGIDNNSKKLLYFNKRKDKDQSTLIDLKEVDKCRFVNVSRSVKTQNGNKNVIDRLELAFTFHNSDIPEKALIFYDSIEFMMTAGELSLIEKWLGIINSNLKNSKK